MKFYRTLISYIFIFIVLYLITFLIFFTSDESFYSLKRLILINGALNLLIIVADRKNKLFYLYPIFFFCSSYISMIIYMDLKYWKKIFISVDNIIYPFTNGQKGLLFSFLFMMIIWLLIFIGKKIKKVNE